MAARKKSTARKPTDAIALLKADHKLVQGLFDQFEKARNNERKGALAGQICAELTVHTRIEEEILYPAAREAMRDEDLLDEAEVEHAGAKDLIAQIEGSRPGADLFDAKVTVLGEYIKHHVKEEHTEMFPKLRKTKLDLKALGERMQARKAQLEAGGGAPSRGRPGSSGGLSGSRRAPSSKSATKPESEGFISQMAREIGLKR